MNEWTRRAVGRASRVVRRTFHYWCGASATSSSSSRRDVDVYTALLWWLGPWVLAVKEGDEWLTKRRAQALAASCKCSVRYV